MNAANSNGPAITVEQAQARVAEKTFPKVTKERIEEKIAEVHYERPVLLADVSLGTLTICVIVMKSGFKFVGKAAPADARNFDVEVGKRYAYEDAFKQIWSHEGYLLCELLSI